MNRRWIICLLLTLFVLCGLSSTTVFAQQEVIVTIKGSSSGDKLAHFELAEQLRNQNKFREAMAEYWKVLSPGELCGKEAEAHYDIGICYTWLGKKDDAEAIFQEVLQTYPNNAEVIAHTYYCLSWIDVQRCNFEAAINRLQETLNSRIWTDAEFCARAEFQIGRIYQAFLHDHEKAQEIFDRVLVNYPDAMIIEHPFFEGAKKRIGVN